MHREDAMTYSHGGRKKEKDQGDRGLEQRKESGIGKRGEREGRKRMGVWVYTLSRAVRGLERLGRRKREAGFFM